jgi:PEP-CTERM motif
MLTRSFLAICLALSCVHANAAIILLAGTSFDVRYDDSTLGNYGNPSISGNVVFLTPTLFKAESLNGSGFATSTGTVNFQIIPKENLIITDITLLERGDYILRGADSFVNVSGQTRAFSLQNPLIDVTNPISSTSNFNVANGLQQNWLATSSLNLTSLSLTDRQAVNYTVENLLEAYTENNANGPRRAFVEKKFSGFSVTSMNVISPVPEASTLLMMLFGIACVGFLAKRKQRQL